jgi:hypothetical protein
MRYIHLGILQLFRMSEGIEDDAPHKKTQYIVFFKAISGTGSILVDGALCMSGDDYCRVIALWNYAGTVERSKARQAAAATGGEPGRENSRAEAENEA